MSMTAAEKAVFHIVRRVQSCPDFAWLMLNTESLALCFAAVAAYKGEPVEKVRKKIEENAASLKETPEIVRLRKQVEDHEDAYQDEEEAEGEFAGILSEVEALLWQDECGLLPLTADRLRAVLNGKPVTHLI